MEDGAAARSTSTTRHEHEMRVGVRRTGERAGWRGVPSRGLKKKIKKKGRSRSVAFSGVVVSGPIL
jgi:hypothetical protein